MLTDMNAEPKDLEKFADIKAALSAQNLRRENERVAENAALNQRYAKKIQLLFPNLMESPMPGESTFNAAKQPRRWQACMPYPAP